MPATPVVYLRMNPRVPRDPGPVDSSLKCAGYSTSAISPDQAMKTQLVRSLVVAVLFTAATALRSNAQPSCTITTRTLITEDDKTYDGCDLVIDGATVTMDGNHHFKSVQIIHSGTLTHSGRQRGWAGQ